jgi:ubiquitin-protein ligase
MSTKMDKEYNFFIKYKSDDESGGPIDRNNMLKWKINFNGPKNSDYEGGKFHVEINFTEEYPKKMPTCKFLNEELLHPNINSNGNVCFGNYPWKEGYTIIDLISALKYLLKNPYFGSGYDNKQVKEFFDSDPEAYHRTVRELVTEFCKY